jgi:ABC-type antimicrobial peptide transport system permease subunit
VNPAPVLKAAQGAAARRRVQSAVMFVVVGVAAASAVLGLMLATNAGASFRKALSKRRAPDLVVMLDATKLTGAELARTRELHGVTQAAGPYPATTIELAAAVPGSAGDASAVQPLTVVGRASSNGSLDRLVCFKSPPGITSCGWPTRTGEIELSSFAPVQLAPGGGRLGPVGEKVTVTSIPGRPTMTVVGYAEGILQQDADAWAVPAEIAALQKTGAPAQEQMLYTFSRDSSNAQINADLAELKAALPAGAVISSASLPNVKHFATAGSSQKPPYVEAYAVIVLLLALLTTAIVVAAALLTGYRRIGVLKSIGFTPVQVVNSYLAQLAVPALAGAVVGTVVASDWAGALTSGWDASAGVPLWIELTVPVAVCALVALAGLVPARRAASLTAVQLLAAGQGPETAGRSRLSRRAGRLPLPRPVALGMASALSRPGASLATAAVITAGLTAAVLALGLNSQMFQLVVGATTPQNGAVLTGQALVRRLTILVTIVAGLGVLSAVIMLAQQRVHDLGVCKAIGMTPRQIVAMITCWVLAPGLLAAAIAVPAGIVLEHAVATAVVDGQTRALSQIVPPRGAGPASPRGAGPASPRGAGLASLRPPRGAGVVLFRRAGGHGARRVIDVPAGGPFQSVGLPDAYNPGMLALVVITGLGVATLAALIPASWAAMSTTTTALRAE